MKQGKLGLLLFIASLSAAAVQFSTGAKVHAQSVDLRAAAEAKADGARAEAKAETARQARALASPSVQHPTAVGAYVVFDVPGAANGTFPTSINLGGAITGYFVDAGQVTHGFLRAQDGAITTFDVPFGNVYGTYPGFISQPGAITGSYADANFVSHGFVRATNGVVTTFDTPGAVMGTSPEAISPNGEVAGFLSDANFVGHGFLRAPNGNLSAFDAPGAGTTTFPQGTYPLALAANGTTYGNYVNDHSHGFLLTKSGAFTSFDAPGDTATFAAFSFGKNFYVNPGGVIAGAYFQRIAGNPFGGNYQVYIRALDGTITTFAAATYSPCCIWSFPTGINPGGVIVGSLNDGFTINHGFLRDPKGSIMTFDAPGAGVGFNQGTVPWGLAASGEVMGRIIDSNYLNHSFIFTPGRPPVSSAAR
jgi:hypothetical protein